MSIFDLTIREWIWLFLFVLVIGAGLAFTLAGSADRKDRHAIDRAAVLLIESDIDAETRRAGVEALAELLRVRRETR